MGTALHVKEGDVFAGRVKDGRFGAVRVLRVTKDGARKGRDTCHLACTTYLGAAVPSCDEPSLRQILRRHRFEFGGALATTIVDEGPPASFAYVGNVPVTKAEARLRLEESYGFGWRLVEDALMEWRFAHQRGAFAREVAADESARTKAARSSAPPRARKRVPRSTLTDADFWALLDRIDPKPKDDDAKIAPLVRALAKRSAADIREFQERLAHALYRLDERRFATRAGRTIGDDAFLYARCAVVAQGRRVYEQVLRDPKRFPRNADLEALLTAAPEAFLRRTGRNYDEVTHYSYETGSNRDGWK